MSLVTCGDVVSYSSHQHQGSFDGVSLPVHHDAFDAAMDLDEKTKDK